MSPYLALGFGGLPASFVLSRHGDCQSCWKVVGLVVGENGGVGCTPLAQVLIPDPPGHPPLALLTCV